MGSEDVVRAVAIRLVAGLLAAAEIGRFRARSREEQRFDAGSFMRAVAEWLACRAPAPAPGVSPPFDQFDEKWIELRGDRIGHDILPRAASTSRRHTLDMA